MIELALTVAAALAVAIVVFFVILECLGSMAQGAGDLVERIKERMKKVDYVERKAAYNRAAKVAEAYRLLNESVGDLAAGRLGSEIFDTSGWYAKAPDNVRVSLRRVWLFAVVLTLSKLEDVLDEYRAVFSSDVRGEAADLKKELERRGVRKFRNTVVAHYRDNKLGRLLTNEEIQERFDVLRGDSVEAFQAWLKTAAETCERIRDRLRDKGV